MQLTWAGAAAGAGASGEPCLTGGEHNDERRGQVAGPADEPGTRRGPSRTAARSTAARTRGAAPPTTVSSVLAIPRAGPPSAAAPAAPPATRRAVRRSSRTLVSSTRWRVTSGVTRARSKWWSGPDRLGQAGADLARSKWWSANGRRPRGRRRAERNHGGGAARPSPSRAAWTAAPSPGPASRVEGAMDRPPGRLPRAPAVARPARPRSAVPAAAPPLAVPAAVRACRSCPAVAPRRLLSAVSDCWYVR